MTHSVLITGGSGYLGGTILARLVGTSLPQFNLFALVRTDAQAEAVRQYGAKPLQFSPQDENAVRDAVLKHKIDVVFWLVDAARWEAQVNFMKALAELKNETGRGVHFLHTTGAKIFASHCGAPTDRPLLDNEPGLYEIHRGQKAPISIFQGPVDTNNKVTETGEEFGVRSYIFAPYGKGEGFGNPISIQTVDVVTAARSVGRVYAVDAGRPSWPVCHVIDTANLYLEILRNILTDKNPPHGKNGYYLGSPGGVVWQDLYSSIAIALQKRGIIKDAKVEIADDEVLEKMAAALECPKEFINFKVGGSCTFTAKRGYEIGWKPEYKAEHALQAMDEEVQLILETKGWRGE